MVVLDKKSCIFIIISINSISDQYTTVSRRDTHLAKAKRILNNKAWGLPKKGRRCSTFNLTIKDGAYYCYCAYMYVLRIFRYSDFLSVMLNNAGIFLHGLKYAEKVHVDLNKYSWYPKRKLGVTMHSLGIIELHCKKERHKLL